MADSKETKETLKALGKQQAAARKESLSKSGKSGKGGKGGGGGGGDFK